MQALKLLTGFFSFLFFFNLGKVFTFLRFCFLTCKTGKIILCLRLFIVSLNSFSSSSVIRGDLTFAGFSAAQNKIYSPETLLHLTWDEWDVNTIKLLARNFLKTSDRHLCLPSSFLRPGTQTTYEMLDLPSWILEEKRPHLRGPHLRGLETRVERLLTWWDFEKQSHSSNWAALLYIFLFQGNTVPCYFSCYYFVLLLLSLNWILMTALAGSVKSEKERCLVQCLA